MKWTAMVAAFLFVSVNCIKVDATSTVSSTSPTFTLQTGDVDDASGAPSVQGPLAPVGDIVKPGVPNVVFYDFGQASIARSEPIWHAFTIKNVSNSQLLIDRIQPGCGCTSVSTGLGKAGAYLPVESGATFVVDVSLDPAQLYIGAINKIVSIYLSPKANPAFTIHIVGQTLPIASFTPDSLNFGTLKYGQPASEKVSIAIDTSFYGHNPPQPFSENKNVTIAATDAPETLNGIILTRNYTVTLAPGVHLGDLGDTIALPDSPTSNTPGPSAPITGTIVGDITAQPSVVAIGALNVGQQVNEKVKLIGNSPGITTNLKVTCSNPDIKVVLKSSAHAVYLALFFKAKDSGPVQAKVSVRTVTGQILDIPVTGWVN